jgi:hypothetical protein
LRLGLYGENSYKEKKYSQDFAELKGLKFIDAHGKKRCVIN